MGLYKVATLTAQSSTLDRVTPTLWTRDGLNGIEVHMYGKSVSIPKDVVLKLLADHLRKQWISDTESMEDHTVWESIGLKP